jgi:hypothetical protein
MANKPQNNDWNQDDQDNYDVTYQQVTAEIDKLGAWILAAVTLTGTGQVINKLTPADLLILKENAPELSTLTPLELDDIVTNMIPLQEIEIPYTTEVYSNFIDENDLTYYKNLSEQFKQYGRIEDTKSIENLHWQNQQTILDRVGLFGNNESTKSGMLDTYIKNNNYSDTEVRIPWVCAGDNTCGDCEDLEAAGPYLPEDYPEPPHYGCECVPGDPELYFPTASMPD